jgi:hypothetical protein
MKKTLEQKVQLKVENGVELGGLISSDLTLYPDVHYIVTSTLLVPAGVTLTILPGATIKFKDYTGFNCQGTLVANGTPGNMITFTKTDLGLGNITTFKINSNTLSYARFDNLIFPISNADGGFEYNVFRVPFAGLAYMVAYCRKHNIDEKHMVVSVKELNATQAYSLELFHLFLNSRIKIRLSLFEDYFSISEGNSFLGEMFDPIIEMIQNEKILQASPDIYSLLD